MNGKTNRRKGHGFEREIANEIKVMFPEAKRQLEYQEDECKGIDIANTGVYAIQCKNHKKYVSVNTIDEIKCGPDKIPVVVTKGQRLPAMAIIPWKDLIRLIRFREATLEARLIKNNLKT